MSELAMIEVIHNLKKELAEKDNRIQELEKVALELAAETLDGVVRYEPARKIMKLLCRCVECGNNIFDEDGICQVCLTAYKS